MTLLNLALWSVHVLLAVAAAEATAAAARLRSPGVALAFRQGVLGLCLLLPFIEPKLAPPRDSAVVVAWTTAAPVTGRANPAAYLPGAAAIIWTILCAGAAYRLVRLGIGMARLRRLRREARPAGQDFSALQRRLGTRALILVTGGLDSPVSFGWLRPAVLLPARWEAEEIVVCHELWHLRRADWPVHVLEQTVAALLWFHPAVAWLVSRIQLAREQAVDARVVETLGDRHAYLTTLLAAAAESRLLAASPFVRRRHLRQRIQQILEEVSMSGIRTFHSALASAAAVALTLWFASHALPLRAAQSGTADNRVVTIAHIDMAGLPAPLAERVSADLPVHENQPLTSTELDDAMSRIQAIDRQIRTFVSENETGMVDVHIFAPGGSAGPAGPATRIRVGGNVQQKRLVSKPVPHYPVEAKEKRIQGIVMLDVLIARDGTVERAQRVSGDPVLASAAIDAVRHWVYETTLLNGNPVEVEANVQVNFTLAP